MNADSAISQRIWDMKYRYRGTRKEPGDRSLEDTWARLARTMAAVEAAPERARWELAFRDALEGFQFLPAGRIIAGAGTGRAVTLFNCFVMGEMPDDLGGIFDHLREAALTLQQGGGIGIDVSPIRPKGAAVAGIGADASGPLSFMDVWDSMCRTIMSAGARRGAMMGVLRCDHPDIEAFIDAKREPNRLAMFNLSVLITDAFMNAIRRDLPWPLHFNGVVQRTVPARALWDRLMRATYECAEPGVVFIDRVNAANNLGYLEHISATNPCGEQPLPPYGACLLGSINLATLVRDPFTERATLDLDRLASLTAVAVRFLDNVIDVSGFPLAAQAAEAREKRRIGLGVTGLADALILCGLRYGSPLAVGQTEAWLAALRQAAYQASAALAAEKEPFPRFNRDHYLAAPMVCQLEPDLRDAIARHGIRNGLLTTIAPTGTISLLAGNISSGIEPVFAFTSERTVLQPDGSRRVETVVDPAYALFRRRFGDDVPLPDYFVDAQSLDPHAHLLTQAAAQTYIDSAISKTINCPATLSFDSFKDVYLKAYELGCKGCTTYRPTPLRGAVLVPGNAGNDAGQAGGVQRASAPAPDAPGPDVLGPDALGPAALGSARDTDGGAPANGGEGVTAGGGPAGRPETLPGETYKVRWPGSDHALYITVNDIIENGRRRPFEVFINSKNMEHYAWTVALTLMISAVFRRGGDVSFVVEELKTVFDPRGGQWINGRYVPSLLAAIGEVIERHLIAIGFLAPAGSGRSGLSASPTAASAQAAPEAGSGAGIGYALVCPRCGTPGLIRQEGCDLCVSCGFSRCG